MRGPNYLNSRARLARPVRLPSLLFLILLCASPAGAALGQFHPHDGGQPVERRLGSQKLAVGTGELIEFGGENSSCGVYFDDGGYAPGRALVHGEWRDQGSGFYRWEVVGRRGGIARVKIHFFFKTNLLMYVGKEYVERAKRNDLSFIKGVNLDEIEEVRVLGGEECPGCRRVIVTGNLTINRTLLLNLNVETGIVDREGEALGRWLLWIDPARYPLKGAKREVVMEDWVGNVTLRWEVRFVRGGAFETPLVKLGRYYIGYTSPEEAELLRGELAGLHLPFPVEPPLLSNIYDPDHGMFVGTSSGDYVDPVLRKEFGIISMSCMDRDRSMRGDSEGFSVVEVWGPELEGEEHNVRDIRPILMIALVIGALASLIASRRIGGILR